MNVNFNDLNALEKERIVSYGAAIGITTDEAWSRLLKLLPPTNCCENQKLKSPPYLGQSSKYGQSIWAAIIPILHRQKAARKAINMLKKRDLYFTDHQSAKKRNKS